MLIIGCDFHPGYQQIAFVDRESGEAGERQLRHGCGEAEGWYKQLEPGARVGMEATGHARWFERWLAACGHQLWVGDPARIRAARVRQQKTDLRDAELILRLLLEERFPRLWVPSVAERDLRQLVLHRHKLVGMRTRVKNQLQALALNEGLQRGHGLWSQAGRAQLEALRLDRWATRRRDELLVLHDQLDRQVGELDGAVRQAAMEREDARRLMSCPGVGPIVSLAFVLTLGPVERFRRGKQVASYLGLIPAEHSSGGHQRLGHISKQGNTLVRWLLVEAAQVAARHEPQWRRFYLRLAVRKCRALAKVALARKLAVTLYWMLRSGQDYESFRERGSHAGQPV